MPAAYQVSTLVYLAPELYSEQREADAQQQQQQQHQHNHHQQQHGGAAAALFAQPSYHQQAQGQTHHSQHYGMGGGGHGAAGAAGGGRVELTCEGDVYAFGVVLMEILSGLAPLDERRQHPSLPSHLKAALSEDRMQMVRSRKSGGGSRSGVAAESHRLGVHSLGACRLSACTV